MKCSFVCVGCYGFFSELLLCKVQVKHHCFGCASCALGRVQLHFILRDLVLVAALVVSCLLLLLESEVTPCLRILMVSTAMWGPRPGSPFPDLCSPSHVHLSGPGLAELVQCNSLLGFSSECFS